MLMRRLCLAAVVSCAVVAAAQTPPPPPPAPAADAPVAPVAAPVEPAAEPAPQIGFRAGGSAGLGVFFPGPQINFHPFDLHAGVQVNPMFGAYLRFGAAAGFGFSAAVSSTGGSLGVSAFSFWLIGANAELGLGDSFFIAAGPQVGIGGWASVKATGSTTGGGVEAVATSGPQPGLDFKIGLGFGGSGSRVRTARRSQFTLALDLSVLYATKVVQAGASGGTTGATVSVSFADAISVAPTLHLGYEFR